MQITLDENGYTKDGKWKLVLVCADDGMRDAGGAVLYGHPRSSAIEWAKEDKFECRADESAIVYDQMIIASPKPIFEERQSRVGDIKIGGEILPEFNSNAFWCRQCGVNIVGENHLPSCTTLATKV